MSTAALLAGPAAADVAGADRVADYMAARVADAEGRSTAAAAGYARALAAAPASAAIAQRAYREALAAGDDALATRAAAVLRGRAVAPPDLALLPLAQAAARGDAAAAETATAALAATPLAILAPSLRGWIAVTRGQDPAPALAVAATQKDPLAQRFAAETGVLLQIARGDADAAVARIPALQAEGTPIDLRIAAAQLLFARGKDGAARALLAGDDPVLAALRAGAPAQPTLGFGVSRLFARVAADLAGQGASPLTLALARTALIADPRNDRARLLLASALAAERSTDRALATLRDTPAASPFARSAAAAQVSVLVGVGREAEALALSRTLAERSDADSDDWQRYADRLVVAGRHAEAAPFYRRVIHGGMAADWAAWLQYGGALEEAGDWPAARAALRKAVALGPQQPLALNYLGYAQATRGENVTAATAMLERALALKPDDDSIRDSLGWAYHLTGDTRRALPLIERAAVGEPDNAEIGDHLGDLYWTLGRRYEARYAWRAAALTAAPKEAARLATKIAQGLPPR